jgi:hypothetical protein
MIRGNVFTGNCAFEELVHGEMVRWEMKYGEFVRGDTKYGESYDSPKKNGKFPWLPIEILYTNVLFLLNQKKHHKKKNSSN